MEGLRKRALLLGIGMLAVGLVAAARPDSNPDRKTEEYLEQKAPVTIPGFTMMLNQYGGTAYTYRMDDMTYEILNPYGIVARKYTNGRDVYDVVLISSDSHESFHDPRICFSAQGWVFTTSRTIELDVPGRGTIPMTLVEMDNQMRGVRGAKAVYFYRGPSGFLATPRRLQWSMFGQQLRGQQMVDCTFYRFMPDYQGASLDDLLEFIKTYMAAADEASGGYF
jgi:hypothetical protein